MLELVKMSKPGFTLTTEDISVVEEILESFVCTMCKSVEYEDLRFYDELINLKENLYKREENILYLPPENKHTLEVVQNLIVGELLSTACGLEFWFTEPEIDYYEEYKKLKKEGCFELSS